MRREATTCYYRIKNDECLRVEIYRGRIRSFEVVRCPDWFLEATPPSPKPVRPITRSIEKEYIKATRDFVDAVKRGDTKTAMSLWSVYGDIIICYLEEL